MKKIITLAVATLIVANLAACTLPKPRALADDEGTDKPVAAQTQEAEPTPEPEPAPELGTLKNPAPPLVPITSTGYDGTTYDTVFTAVNTQGNQAVADANMFNDAAPAGQHYVIVTVQITNTSADAAKGVRPGSAAYDISLVDETTGQSYSSTTTVLANGISGQNEIFTGQVATGEIAYLVRDTAGALLGASGGVFVRLP